MKQKHNGGFSLIETVVAIAILGLIVVPCCSGMLVAIRVNEKAQQMMQAQLAVSSAVETLMAEGITKADAEYDKTTGTDLFPEVTIKTEKENVTDPYYTVIVADNENLVTVTTTIRAKGVAGS